MITLVLSFALVVSPVRQDEIARGEKLFAQAKLAFEQATDASLRQARVMAQEAEVTFKGQKAWDQAAAAARLVGSTYLEQGQRERADGCAEEILEIARLSGDKKIEASGLMFRAIILQRDSQPEESFALVQRARQLYTPNGTPTELANVAWRLATLYLEMGQLRMAEALLREAQTYAVNLKDERLDAQIGLQFAMVYNRRDLPDQALPFVNRTLAVAKGSERYLVLTVAATNALLRGDAKLSAKYAQQSLDVANRLKNPNWARTAYIRIGNAQLAAGQLDAAEASFRQVIEHDKSPRPRSQALKGLGKVFAARGQYKLALDRFEEAVENMDLVLSRRRAEEDRMTLVRLFIEPYKLVVDTLLQLYFETGQIDYAFRAFDANERIRNRTFVEQLQAARQRNADPAVEPDSRLRTIERQITDVSKALVNNQLDPQQAQKLRDTLRKLEVDQSVMRHEIAIRRDIPDRPIGFDEVNVPRAQTLVADNGSFIEFSIGQPSAAFLITRSTFDVIKLDVDRGIAERVNGFIALLSEPGENEFGAFGRAAGTQLYVDLVKSVLAKMPSNVTHLVFSADETIQHLPFEALTRDSNGHFLVEDYSVSYLPAASTYPMILNWRPTPNSKALLAFADPAYAETGDNALSRSLIEDEALLVNPLRHSRDETSAVVSLAGEDSSDLFVGSDASEDRIKTMDLSGYRILHFATHAVVSSRQPQRSALVLTLGPNQTEDGFLQMREIYALRLNADMVVLSACETGQGTETEVGEGITGLARAFFFAGSRSLVATLWKVGDSETATAVTKFYEYLSQGFSKAESLRRTKIDLIKSNVPPRHWAGLVLYGEGRSPVRLRPSSRMTLYIPAAVLALIILAVLIYISMRPREYRH